MVDEVTLLHERTTPRTRYAVPVAGAVAAVAGAIGVGALADSATEADGLAAFDPRWTADVLGLRSTPLTDLARALTFIGDVPVLCLLTLLAAYLLWRRTRSYRAPGLLLVAMAGSAALTYGLKLLVGRHRPGITYVLGPVDTGYAFPSGHTLNSAVFFGALAALLVVGLHSRPARAAVITGAVLISLGIGLSRLYLGYHWATDVLAGWLIAVTWLTIVGTVAYLIRPAPEPGGRVIR
jgi:membrane-associated phospholipid phosphatase